MLSNVSYTIFQEVKICQRKVYEIMRIKAAVINLKMIPNLENIRE